MPPLDDEMFWGRFTDAAQVLSGYATALGLFIALLSAALVLLQVQASKRAAQQTLALETHREYLKLCIEHPHLTGYNVMLRHLKRRSFAGVRGQPETAEVEQCLWFVSYMLHTMEQLIETTTLFHWRRLRTSVNEGWEQVARAQVDYHRGLLEEMWDEEFRTHYSRRFRRIVEDELGVSFPD